MQLENLLTMYQLDRQDKPYSINHLLDYCQQLYIHEKIDIVLYRDILYLLNTEGAVSVHEITDNNYPVLG
ncbi:YppF family protein [Radiobacillus sp. PE A8.2]|uniref:YppF family protein n=1 Tax=Radiobacillus sp. PE A8.2 TaxID=3380349 RepID=UPI0038910B9F